MRLLVLFIIMFCTLSFAQNYGHWEFTDSMQYGRWEHSSTVLENGNVLVAGGYGLDASYSAEIYDINTNNWTLVENMNDYHSGFSLVNLPGNKALAFGVPRRLACEIYDATINQWYYTDSLDLHRSLYAATKMVNGKIMIAGGIYFGEQSSFRLSSCEIFDPQSETWSYIDSMQLQRRGHSLVSLQDCRVMVTGGEIGSGSYSSRSCEIYDPNQNEWKFTDSLPTPKFDHNSVLMPNGDVLVSGGQDGLCYLFDISSETWRNAGQMYWYRVLHETIPLSDSTVMFVGGIASISDATWEIYNPYKSQTLFYDSLTIANYASSAHKLSNGTIINIGGFIYDYPVIIPKKECMIFYPKTTGLVSTDNTLLAGFELKQNYPNPFNPATKIRYEIPDVTLRQHFDKLSVAAQSDRLVQLKVYDVLGNEVATLVNEHKPAGSYEIEFKGEGLPSGVYFYKLQAGNYIETKKMLLLK